jgi:hypothetical protein
VHDGLEYAQLALTQLIGGGHGGNLETAVDAEK